MREEALHLGSVNVTLFESNLSADLTKLSLHLIRVSTKSNMTDEKPSGKGILDRASLGGRSCED